MHIVSSSQVEKVAVITHIATTPNYILVLENNDIFPKFHLLTFHSIEVPNVIIFYKHRLFFFKNLNLEEDFESASVTNLLAIVFSVATEEETEDCSLVTNPGTVTYLLGGRNFQLSIAVGETFGEQQNAISAAVSCPLEIELQSLLSEGEWELLPPTTKMDCFVNSNLLPLPTNSWKKVYASFPVFIDENTFVVAKVGIYLRIGSFINTRTRSSSMQVSESSVEGNKIITIEEKKVSFLGVLISYTVKRKVFLLFIGETFEFEVKFQISLLVSDSKEVFISPSSEDTNFKFNGQKVLPDQTALSLVEEFFHSVDSVVVQFRSVKMSFFVPKEQHKMETTLFFPVIEVVSKSTVAEETQFYRKNELWRYLRLC